MKAKHLGKLIKIVIRHDNTGNLPGWYLNKVKTLFTKYGTFNIGESHGNVHCL